MYVENIFMPFFGILKDLKVYRIIVIIIIKSRVQIFVEYERIKAKQHLFYNNKGKLRLFTYLIYSKKFIKNILQAGNQYF